MSKAKLQAVRGMNDILPGESALWQYLGDVVRQVVESYGYQQVRLPIVESTELFKRSIGEVTDIVEKEMYTFADRNGDSLTLRPEGTAGCVRACLEHGLLHNQTQRLWYAGPMFRHERPQKGRYRQFHQIGVESFGLDGPDIDVEVIAMTARLWKVLGLEQHVTLELNSLGDPASRKRYRDRLVSYLVRHKDVLDADSLRRLESNPLRVLDSKNPEIHALLKDAPDLLEEIDEDARQHFEELQARLEAVGIPYRVNPRLVRGLDYYNRTVFEWVTDALGAQGTVCAGGRYDGLVSQLGGKDVPAVGFAMGVERLLLLIQAAQPELAVAGPVDIYLATLGIPAQRKGLELAEMIRTQAPAMKVMLHCGGGSFKKQLKKADKSGARFAVIIGEDEVAEGAAQIKDLRYDKPQTGVAFAQLGEWFNQVF